MEVTLKQAVILQTIASRPGITGPELYEAIKSIVPPANIPQHLGRLRRKALIRVEKTTGTRGKVNSLYLTRAGEKELAQAKKVAAVLSV